MKNLFSILAVIFCAVALTSCKTTEPEGNQVQGITLNKPFDLAIGETRTIIAKVIPETALDKSITWTSSDDKIATVDKKGVVKGIAIGKIVITATAVNSVKASCEVNIIENAIFLETLKFKNDTVIIDMGQNRTFDFSKEIQMFPEDANANTTIEWFVSLYSSYIEIDKSTGIATMLQATGTETYAEIVAKAGSITDTCRVAILDASTPLIGDFFYSDQTF